MVDVNNFFSPLPEDANDPFKRVEELKARSLLVNHRTRPLLNSHRVNA